MLLKEYGFRPVYHNVCIFKLNDKLRDLIKACPDADKSSHAVCYGYIDAKKGLMLEVLCGGKQAPKYFYFKDVYEGERITIPATDLKNVEFDVFSNLEPRFRKKLNSRIEPLKKYDALEELEKTRGEDLGFLDAFRDLQHPDVVRVIFQKTGLQDEEVQVSMTGTGDHCLLGTVRKNPKQDFGCKKGDTISFYTRQTEDEEIEIYADLNEEHEQADAEEEENSDIQNFTNHEELRLAVLVGKLAAFNYALYQNRVNPIRGIRIINDTGDPITGLSLRITSDTNLFTPYEAALPSIPSGKPISLPDPHLKVNGKELAAMTDAVNALITVELVKNGETICGARGHMMVFAYDQWMGGIGYRYLLPAFVIPAHPVIPALMHDTAERLTKWGKPSTLEGYQQNDPNRVRDLAAAAYATIQKRNFVYAEPPVSFFSAAGQQIRTPETIIEQRLGTCMDMTLLYAALLEGIGLHALLVLIQGHIFAGVWLRERTVEELKASNVVIDHVEQLTMRIDNGSDELTFVECTGMCAGKQVSFEEAETIAKQSNLNPSTFDIAIDVFLSRCHGINPIPPRMREGGTYQIEVSDKSEDELTDAPTDLGLSVSEIADIKPKKITNKRELWESKLLDLSTHNMLLDLPLNASVEPIMSSHIDELEDALSDGHEFNLLPIAEWLVNLAYAKIDENGKPGKEVQWLPEALKECGVFEMTRWPVSADFDFNEKFRQEYRNHRLYTYCAPKQLERELTTIYRTARASQQENGVSSLYLAIGLLRWFAEPDSKGPCYAPLILIPIEIVRKSANQGYALHARADEPHFNTTLLEMLKQNFNINIGGLDPLPSDGHGIDIKKVFAIVRNSLFTVHGWDVVETCVIGNFSFAQFAMWNDIHTAGDMLEKSDVVRSLMKGHVDWDVKLADDLDDEKTYLPITVDATQLQAIKMAAHGTTFVLHGPPGTGKSQTITGMIANLMAQSKRVLFVAEKMAALSVVQRRLSSLGIGDFCVELHSDKANKKQVLSQLDKALTIKHPSRRTEYEEYFKKAEESRARLDGYAKHLHEVRGCGYSLRELIDLFETVRDAEHYVKFDRHEAGRLTKEQICSHSSLIGRLIAAGEAIGDIASNPLSGVGLTSYSAEIRGSLHQYAENYIDALESARKSGAEAAKVFCFDAPQSKASLASLEKLILLYDEKKGTESQILSILSTDSSVAYDYFDKKEKVSTEEQTLLSIWKPEFLKMDMSSFLAKHEAAGKKFFGKSSAMANATAEVQKYSADSISYDQIPALLSKVTDYQANVRSLNKEHDALPDMVRKLVDELKDRASYASAERIAYECKKQAEAFPGGLNAILEMAEKPENEEIFRTFKESLERMASEEERFNALLERKAAKDTDNWIENEIKFCRYLMENAAALKDWGLYSQVRRECVNAGLTPVVEAYESDPNVRDLEFAYKNGLYYALINDIIDKDDVLSCFSGATFNESIQQFKKLDDLMLQQTKQEIYYLLASRVPSSWDSPEVGSELNLLRKAIGSNARGMSIRALFERIPHVLQTLCPCMLMSPNSVAQYLAQDNNLFDVVIFDEASQLPTCKTVGALSRAKNAVIVGDPKQMPPTAFFAGSGPDVDDLALDDLESILDDALALGIPSQHLQWHYRSTHESLIAFSNNEFYENKMYTFPSANDRERHVTAVHVEGMYSKSTNVKEAEAVVQEIVRRFLDPELKKQSIGVVTFNVKQQTLIENLLAKQFQNNAELDMWANSGDDPLFVKNLENVQGDERDVILFSIGYGPDEKGHISMNFGPINKTGGGKRLNVAFSRARVTMTIFASLYSGDIKVTENSPEGLVAFRDFLKFAEGQDIRTESASDAAEKQARAGILQNICKTITDHGYQCVAMVGHSDFRIDIAVVDPFAPTKYMLGILLDGDGYRQTKNTRDREVAQISVLKNLGWSLARVWTIDWWDNREKVINKLISKLDALKTEAKQKAEEAKASEELNKALEAERETEEARVKAELENQAAEVIVEDEEAEKEQRTLEKSVAESMPDSAHETENESMAADDASQASNDGEQLQHESQTEADDPFVGLLQKIADAEGKIIDKRQNGGALWIVGGKNLSPIMNEFKKMGISFIFKAGGGKATGGKDGWWAKTEVILPNLSGKNSISVKPTEETLAAVNSKIIGAEISVKEDKENEGDAAVQVVAPGVEDPSVEDAKHTEENMADAAVQNTDAKPVDYVEADLPVTKMSQSDFAAASNKKEISNRILAVLAVEAPILKDNLLRRIWTSFGILKTNAAIEATEKAMKAARVKTSRQKGIIYCWAPDQDPKEYAGIRISSTRSGDEICPQEIKNAACYVLKNKGELSKDDLIKEVSLLFGYRRLGKNLEAALAAGVQYAKTSGAIISVPGGKYAVLLENGT